MFGVPTFKTVCAVSPPPPHSKTMARDSNSDHCLRVFEFFSAAPPAARLPERARYDEDNPKSRPDARNRSGAGQHVEYNSDPSDPFSIHRAPVHLLAGHRSYTFDRLKTRFVERCSVACVFVTCTVLGSELKWWRSHLPLDASG